MTIGRKMALDPLTAWAKFGTEVAKVVGQVLATKTVRHLEAAKDAGRRYIHINEGFGENADLKPEEKEKLLKKFRKRFFHFS